MPNHNAPHIFDYLDFRSFLKDFIEYKKRSNRKYSYRFFSSKAGFASTNFLNLVIQGKRNLSNNSLLKLADGLRLGKQEKCYFENLVLMNQATTLETKDHYYQRLLKTKPFNRGRQLDRSSYDYFSKWYYPAIRELIEMMNAPQEAHALAATLIPKITPGQARKALEALMRLGLVKTDQPSGKIAKAEATLMTAPEVSSIQITKFHKAMMQLASQSIERFSPQDRDISGVLVGINENKMPEIKEKIDHFRKEIIALAEDENTPNQVVYIQINAFPLSEKVKEK